MLPLRARTAYEFFSEDLPFEISQGQIDLAGSYHFGTDKAERMEIVAGSCEVKLDGSDSKMTYSGGQYFDVPAKSGFDIAVTDGIAEYICSFID